jgi:hypothetical protein
MWNGRNTVKVKSLAPIFCFELFISITQDLFNSTIYPNSRDQVLHLYIVQNEKPLNMKHTEKNKLQYFEKNYRKKDKIIVKMFERRFFVATGIYYLGHTKSSGAATIILYREVEEIFLLYILITQALLYKSTLFHHCSVDIIILRTQQK